MSASRGVLLAAHGTPESLDEMPAYLRLVRGGRPPSAELVEEMRHNYAAIGGRSPLTDITRAQAAALEAELEVVPVLVGMRNWKPFIADAIDEARAAGLAGLVVIPMAPQYSTLSVAKYRQAVEAAAGDMRIRFVDSWHAEPALLDAFAERLREALSEGPVDAVVFTAHSLPLRAVEEGDPYAAQVEQTARGVAERAGLAGYERAWQSAGRTPEPWLAPSLEEKIEELAARGLRQVLVAPVGFVCDHTEVLYDIDVQARGFAAARGVTLRRTGSLNTSPAFIRALGAVARRALAG